MSIGISFYGRADEQFKVETVHYAEGTENDDSPYDQIAVVGEGRSRISFYILREQTRVLRDALTKLDVDYPIAEPRTNVKTTKEVEITVEINDEPREGMLIEGSIIEITGRYNEGTDHEVIAGKVWISPLDFGFDDGRDREVEVEIPAKLTA